MFFVDFLVIEGYKFSFIFRNLESKFGDWYYYDGINGKELF